MKSDSKLDQNLPNSDDLYSFSLFQQSGQNRILDEPVFKIGTEELLSISTNFMNGRRVNSRVTSRVYYGIKHALSSGDVNKLQHSLHDLITHIHIVPPELVIQVLPWDNPAFMAFIDAPEYMILKKFYNTISEDPGFISRYQMNHHLSKEVL